MGKNKVLLIGWDAADWKVINPLIDAGQMPALESMINKGVMGNLATLNPPFSPILWTTIATGMYADKHGVLGFIEPMSNQIGVRPVSAASRKVKAIWNILTQKEYKTHVVGWWPSHPAEPINGIMVSNLAQKVAYDPKKMEFPLGAVHPNNLSKVFEHLRIHPIELTHEHLLPFVPKMNEVDQKKDHRLSSVAKILSENSTNQAYITWILDNNDWDFAAVYFDGIDHFSHLAMKYHPPKLPWVSQKDFDIYQDVINSAYRFFDMTLQKLLSFADDDTTVILVSDHGFVSDNNRQSLFPMEPAGPANDHREHGIFVASGPGIKKDERLYGATMLDITPTILHCFDLPIGKDMDGRVLTEIFDDAKPVQTIDSWEQVEGNSGKLPEDLEEDPIQAQEALRQLVELGYIEKPDENAEKAVAKASHEKQYNLSRVLTGAGKHRKALPVLQNLYEENADDIRVGIGLARCLYDCKDHDKSILLLNEIEKKIRDSQISEDEISELKEKLKNTIGSEEKEGKKKESAKSFKNTVRQYHQNKYDLLKVLMLKAEILVETDEADEGFIVIQNILNEYKDNSDALFTNAKLLLKTKNWDKAAEIYRNLIEKHPESYSAHHGYGLCLLRQNKPQDSLEPLLHAISLQFYNPRAHFHVGQALAILKEYTEAATALEACLKMMPGFNIARNLLINIYKNNLDNESRAAELQNYFKNGVIQTDEPVKENNPLIVGQNIKRRKLQEDIIIVSGLPRSGTSLMMQILEHVGVDILQDEIRTADDSNPKGYYEFEKVKNLAQDASWLSQAKGKSVKIVSHLLHFLPARFNYKVIFMLRNVHEIVSSQNEMLVKQGRSKENTVRLDLINNYAEHLKKITSYLSRKHNMDVIFVNYNALLSDPDAELKKISEFLPEISDIESAVSIIDPSLYRSKL